MALILNRTLYQNGWRYVNPAIACIRGSSNVTMTPVKSQTLNKDFWDKNRNLARPMSPHLSIYKLQMTTVLSISHRATGLAVTALLYGGGLTALFSGYSFPEIFQFIQNNVHQSLIVLVKTGLGGSMIYHTLAGCRHLIWDIGLGLNLKHLYLSGYIVVALTALGTALVFIKQ